jgi:hypothetical protein
VRRADAIMEVTPMQLVVDFFENAFEAASAEIPADLLEASLKASDHPSNPFPDIRAAEDAQAPTEASSAFLKNIPASPQDQPAANPADSQEKGAAANDAILGQAPAPTPSTPPAPAPHLRPENDDAAHVMARARGMSQHHHQEGGESEEDASSIMARVNAMMREEQSNVREGDDYH